MRLIWPIIKETAVYYWEEIFYLTVYNFVTIVALFPSLLMTAVALDPESVVPPLVAVPISLISASLVPIPLFGMFGTVHEIAQGKAIKLSTFFVKGWQMKKHAYIWWVINVVVIILLTINIVFYQRQFPGWGGYVSTFFVGVLLTWLVIQAFALTFYSKLVEPGFKMATRNALALIAMRPIPIIFTMLLAAILLALGFFVRIVGIVIVFAIVATLINMTTHLILKEVQPDSPEEDEVDGSIFEG